MKRGQNGFGAVEALLFLILVSILGFTGYYVYHSRNNANSTYNSAASSNNSPVPSRQSSTPQVFYFKELGAYITLTTAPLKGNLDYEVNTSDGVDYLDLFTPATQEALNKCAPGATGGIFMTIFKKAGQFNQSDYPDGGLLKQFKNFYIVGTVPNGIACADTASQQDRDNWSAVSRTHINAVQDAFKTATQ